MILLVAEKLFIAFSFIPLPSPMRTTTDVIPTIIPINERPDRSLLVRIAESDSLMYSKKYIYQIV